MDNATREQLREVANDFARDGRRGDTEAIRMAAAIHSVLNGAAYRDEDEMKLYTGACRIETAVPQVCKLGTLGCVVKHARRPADVVLVEAKLEAVDRVLAEWSNGTAAERNCADDLRVELDRVAVPR